VRDVRALPGHDLFSQAWRGAQPGVLRLLIARRVASILRVPRSTIYELARNRRVPFVKVGRRTLFEPDSLREWIDAHTVQPR